MVKKKDRWSDKSHFIEKLDEVNKYDKLASKIASHIRKIDKNIDSSIIQD